MSCCNNIGTYKKGVSIRLKIKFDMEISTLSDVFAYIKTGETLLGKYSLNPANGYDSDSVKISDANPKWLELYIDTSVTAQAVAGAVYNLLVDYQQVNSNFTSGVEVKKFENPVFKFTA